MRFITIKVLLVFTLGFTIFSCSDNNESDDCTKTIATQQIYVLNNQVYSYDSTLEVPCDFPDPEEVKVIEPPILENFSYNVLLLKYTPDTGNNTSKLEFQIELNNLNDFKVKGVPYLTINSDGLEFSTNYGISNCNEIEANSTCIISFEAEDSLDLGFSNSVNLVDVVYYLTY